MIGITVAFEDGTVRHYRTITECAEMEGLCCCTVKIHADECGSLCKGRRIYYTEDFDELDCYTTWDECVAAKKSIRRRARPVRIMTLDCKKGKVIPCVMDASREFGRSRSTISEWCKVTAYGDGYFWFFEDEFLKMTPTQAIDRMEATMRSKRRYGDTKRRRTE